MPDLGPGCGGFADQDKGRVTRHRTYTGVGSRKTPLGVQQVMHDMAVKLALHEITLRSGAALGADQAFERGCDTVHGPKEVFIPWEGFQRRTTGERGVFALSSFSTRIRSSASRILREIHPWGLDTSSDLLTRNVLQVLGPSLGRQSLFVIAWTPRGELKGGTRIALLLARKRGIPVFNLGSREWTLREIVIKVRERRQGD